MYELVFLKNNTVRIIRFVISWNSSSYKNYLNNKLINNSKRRLNQDEVLMILFAMKRVFKKLKFLSNHYVNWSIVRFFFLIPSIKPSRGINGTYSRSASKGIRRGTCCKSLCEQSTVCPVHVQTRGHFWSMLLVPTFVFARLVPCTKIPTLPTLLNVPNESPFPYGISCNNKITKLVAVAFTTQLSGGFFIFDIISHIWLSSSNVIWLDMVVVRL